MIEPLDDLEMFELLQIAYPEKFPGDDDETFEAAQEFAESISGWEEVADLLGRVVMMSPLMASPLTDTARHCLGRVSLVNGYMRMRAAVSRDYEPQQQGQDHE
jgi:hypothetical protein